MTAREDTFELLRASTGSANLIVMKQPTLIRRASEENIARFTKTVEELPYNAGHMIAAGEPYARAVVMADLMESEIQFRDLVIWSSWINAPANEMQQRAVENALDRSYSPLESARVTIEGVMLAREAAGFLRAIRYYSQRGEAPSTRTQIGLMKLWER